jgi:hypothetical protein
VCLGIAVVVAAIFGWRLQGQVKAATERARISALKADTVIVDSTRQIDAARAEAADLAAEVREIALRSQRIADVAAAPDLIRFSLSGADGASGQGDVQPVARLRRERMAPSVADGSGLYQVWLLTRTAPVKAGTLLAASDGTAVLAQPTPAVPRSVIGVMVSQEVSESVETPSGAPVLTSVAPTAPAAAPNTEATVAGDQRSNDTLARAG